MVAESALDPSVSSAVGARGLMQLMPEVGQGLHQRLFPGRPFVSDDLFSAPYNVALGATELSDRAASLKGALSPSAVPAVIASYNAAESDVRRWIGTAPSPPSDEFAEDIGFVETRSYVRRVMGFAMAYRWVYGDG
jgi:soluble lytic murein transglycosylase